MPPPQTGRQRAARIPLDYYKHPTLLDWGRGWWALGLAALVALGWWGSGWLWAGQGQAYYSRGPVAAVHASWDSDCTACHTPFTPVGGEAWAKRFVSDAHAMNQKCEACHAGPPHHASATPELACASCHHDHRGRDASLVRTGGRRLHPVPRRHEGPHESGIAEAAGHGDGLRLPPGVPAGFRTRCT